MTVKQKLFVKKYIENKGNGTETVLSIYNTSNRNAAGVIASQLLSIPRVRRAVDEEIDKYLN